MLGLAAIFLAGCAKEVYPITPLTPAHLTGVWFGLTSGDVEFCRLELNSRGSGILGIQYSTQTPDIYFLKSWSLSGQRFDAVIVAQGSAEPVNLRGETEGGTLKLTISGQTWQRLVSFRREDSFEQRQNLLKQAMLKSAAEK